MRKNVKKQLALRVLSTAALVAMVSSIATAAFADTYDLNKGSVTVETRANGITYVTQKDDNQADGYARNENDDILHDYQDKTGVTITSDGRQTSNTITVETAKDQTTDVTLEDVFINREGARNSDSEAALTVKGDGDTNIELNGNNTLSSTGAHAGLEKTDAECSGTLTITDDKNDGKNGGSDKKKDEYGYSTGGDTGTLAVIGGGECGASIGGQGTLDRWKEPSVTDTAERHSTSNITITGGNVTAVGKQDDPGRIGGAGIGGGLDARGSGDVTVSGDAKLKVRGGKTGDDGQGAGIGNGGVRDQNGPVNGTEVEPDICALNPSGKIEYYAPGSVMTGTPSKTVTNPTGDHAWDSGRVTKPATCTEKGVKTYTCTRHSSHTKNEEIPALNHSFDGQEYVSDNNATCGQDGTKTIRCVRYGTGGCTETDTVTDTGSKLGHFFEVEDYVSNNDATCEQDGTKTAKCVRYGTGGCTETDTVTDTGSKLGHLFEDYVSNNDATYAHDGTKTAKCVRYDQCGETHTMPDEGSRLIAPPLYRVTDKDGRDIAYTAEQKGGVLTVTVDEDLAILTGRLSGIRTLKAQGVEKIIFVTKGATSAFLLSDLLDKGEGGEAYRLTHNGKAVTFTLGESMADVSAILIKP